MNRLALRSGPEIKDGWLSSFAAGSEGKTQPRRCVFPGPLIFSGRLCPRCRSDWWDCSRRAQRFRQRELACSASCCCPLSSKSSQSRWCWCSIQQKRRHWRILHRRSRRLEQEQVKSCQARQPGLSRYVSSGTSVWSRPMPALGGSSPEIGHMQDHFRSSRAEAQVPGS